jgi:hypothetical protein
MFPFLIPPYSSIHSYIFAKGRGEERAKKKKQLEPAEATATAAACELEDPIGLFFFW